MADAKNETPKPANFVEGAKSIGDKLLYELNYKVTRNLPSDLQKFQVDACDHVGAIYPNSSCQGIRDAVVDSKWR